MGGGIVIGSQESGPSAEVKTMVVYSRWEGEYGGDIITARKATGNRQKMRDILQLLSSDLSLVFPIGRNYREAKRQGTWERAEQRKGTDWIGD